MFKSLLCINVQEWRFKIYIMHIFYTKDHNVKRSSKMSAPVFFYALPIDLRKHGLSFAVEFGLFSPNRLN